MKTDSAALVLLGEVFCCQPLWGTGRILPMGSRQNLPGERLALSQELEREVGMATTLLSSMRLVEPQQAYHLFPPPDQSHQFYDSTHWPDCSNPDYL